MTARSEVLTQAWTTSRAQDRCGNSVSANGCCLSANRRKSYEHPSYRWRSDGANVIYMRVQRPDPELAPYTPPRRVTLRSPHPGRPSLDTGCGLRRLVEEQVAAGTRDFVGTTVQSALRARAGQNLAEQPTSVADALRRPYLHLAYLLGADVHDLNLGRFHLRMCDLAVPG
jgi:hypothetical protein